jgi:cell wall-associated NlpC family hydrolase
MLNKEAIAVLFPRVRVKIRRYLHSTCCVCERSASTEVRVKIRQKLHSQSCARRSQGMDVRPEMLEADFWINRLSDAEKTILTATEIAIYNQTIRDRLPAIIHDLTLFPTRIAKADLEGWLTAPSFPTRPLYLDGEPLTPAYYQSLHAQLNLKGLTAQNQVRYGFTTARTNIRTFPVADLVLEEPDHPECDYFQETGLGPAEPVIILHQNPTAAWSYIQTGHYRGWTPTAALAIAASRRQWLDYLELTDFLVVTGINFTIPSQAGMPPYYFEMGAKLPLAAEVRQMDGAYPVVLPLSNRQNRLQLQQISLPAATIGIHLSYLNYTRANLLRQAFKFYGQPYDWGGLQGGVDCSSLILNLYRCFGFALPRNTAEQEQLPGKRIKLAALNAAAKKDALGNLSPGTALFMDGHVMLYLGTVNDTPYILQVLSSYGVPDQLGQIHKTYPQQVTVTDLSLLHANGQSFLQTLTSAVALE